MLAIPDGYAVRNINYGMELLVNAFPDHHASLVRALSAWRVGWADIELEWNNKDEFFDRDLINFEAIHRARGLAVGVVVTRGPRLQEELRVRGLDKFGARSTHWEKLMPRLDLGRGGATPIVALGLEPDRIRP